MRPAPNSAENAEETAEESSADWARRMKKIEINRQVSLYFITAIWVVLMALALAAVWWMCHYVAAIDRTTSFELYYQSAENWDANYRFEIPEKNLPAKVLAKDPDGWVLPYVEVGTGDSTLSLKACPTGTDGKMEPRTEEMNFVAPFRTMPALYVGELILTDPTGKISEQRLPISIHVRDPLAPFREALLYFAGVTTLLILAACHFNPVPFGYVRNAKIGQLMTPLKRRTSEIDPPRRTKYLLAAVILYFGYLYWLFRDESPIDPVAGIGLWSLIGGILVLGVLFLWVNPFGRSRLSLQYFAAELPEGQIEFFRSNPFTRKNHGISVTLRIWDESLEDMRVIRDWPDRYSLKLLKRAYETPSQILTFGARRNYGDTTILVTRPDLKQHKAVAFEYLRELPEELDFDSDRKP